MGQNMEKSIYRMICLFYYKGNNVRFCIKPAKLKQRENQVLPSKLSILVFSVFYKSVKQVAYF